MNLNEGVMNWKDRVAYLLLFLFPVAGMSVRHWISAIFTFLVLLSFGYIFKKSHALAKEEKVLLWILAAFFIVFVISALANGWTERQSKYLGVEVRYLLAVPAYLMIRQLPDACKWVLRGCIIGGIVLGAQAYYDTEILQWERATGIYSPNLMGPFAVLVAFWMLVKLNEEQGSIYMRLLYMVSFICATYAFLLSGSRGAYLGFIVISLFLFFFYVKGVKRIAFGGAIIILTVGAYNTMDIVSNRVNALFNETPHAVVEGVELLDGVEARFEMWRASLLLIKENPVLGIGRGNYEFIIPGYIEKGYINKAIEYHGLGHPHNAYLEVFVSKGIVGFVVFVGMLLYPLYLFIREKRSSSGLSMLGVVLIIGFSLFSLTDASPFIKGNYSSIFLLFLTVFFSANIKMLFLKKHVV